MLFKSIMGPRNLKKMLGQERESSRERGRKRTRDCIQQEYYIAIDKAIHEEIFDYGYHGSRKHLKKSIKAYFGRDPNAILYSFAKNTGNVNTCRKDSFIVTWSPQKNSGILRE